MIHERFTYYKPPFIRARPESLPTAPGIYLVCTDDQVILDKLQIDEAACRAAPAGFKPLYVGSAVDLRRRVQCHVKNSSLASTLRGSLGALLLAQLELTPLAADIGGALWFKQEAILTEWIDQNCIIGVREDPLPLLSERGLIDELSTPLNISFRKASPGARYLMKARAAMRRSAREDREKSNLLVA